MIAFRPPPVFAIVLALGVCLSACRRQTPVPASPPALQVSGTLALDGLTAPVRVVRDRWGVPHLYAQSQDDLFFAQGFVQAQDRLFQMDLWRRSTQGRLSEVLGANFIERDAMTRRMQYHGDVREEWAAYGADAEAIASAFVRGINAWVDRVREHPPEEFALAGWRPEHWGPNDLLNRTDAFVASGNAVDEVLNARLVASLGVSAAQALLPAASPRLTVPPGLDVQTISYVVTDALRAVGPPPFFSGLSGAVTNEVRPKADATKNRVGDVRDALPRGTRSLPRQPEVVGSNAWAIAGVRSATGAPLLAADPHRALDHPSSRYLIHLTAPGWNVIGATAPWLPGVAIGHNDRVAWAMTARAADEQDLYVEKLNPENPHQVWNAGRWVNTKRLADPIAVKGRATPFPFERESTPHGVIIASDRGRHLAFVVAWAGFESGAAAELGSLALDRVASEADIRVALDRWRLPAATFVYAIRDGGVGERAAGLEPVRRSWNGTLPVPGWTGRHEWQGFRNASSDSSVPSRSARGDVISANESLARTRRLTEVLASKATFSVDDFKYLQHDTRSWSAERLVALLERLHSDRAEVEQARQRLVQWDRQMAPDSRDATLYESWARRLWRMLVLSRLDATLADDFIARRRDVFIPALTETTSSAWLTKRPARWRDQLLLDALAETLAGAVNTAKDQADPWPAWGTLHTALFHHPLAVARAARQRFDVGPFGRGGDADTVMSTGGIDLEQTTGASFRFIADLSDWDRSVATNAPGQSGSPASPHFADLAPLWSAGDYFPLAFTDAAVGEHEESRLMLTPRR